MTSQPSITNAQLGTYFDTLAAGTPEATGAIFVRSIPDLTLYNYLETLAADPTTAFQNGPAFSISPGGTRTTYCLTQLMAARPSLTAAADIALPAGLDWCATAAGRALQASGASGQPVETMMLASEGAGLGLQGASSPASAGPDVQTLRSLDQAFGSTVIIFEPVYSSPSPATAAARQKALQGWVGGMFNTADIVQGALGTTADLQVSLSGADVSGQPQVVASRFTGGALGASRTFTVDAGGTWTISIRQPPTGFLSSGAGRGLEVGLAGLLVTVVLLLVMRALVAARREALAVADVQTGVVEHVTLHDPVTGLPNRSLVVDRAEQMLVRSRRSQLPCRGAWPSASTASRSSTTRTGHQTGDELLRSRRRPPAVGAARSRHGGQGRAVTSSSC